MVYYIGNIPCGKDELYHFGILGMKWGVRRYRNTDGSLTAAGKARYKPEKPKRAQDMTDQELIQAINRMRNEKAYNELISERAASNSVKKGAKAVAGIMSTLGSVVLKPFAAAVSKELGTAVGKSLGAGLNDQQENKGNNKNKDEEKRR